MAASPELRVTGIGCVTSIGTTAVAAASAFRAGIVRPTSIAFVDVDDGPVTGRPVIGLTDGFVQFGRWLRLALAAFDDWRANAPPTDDEFWQRTAVIACLPRLDEERFALPTRDVGSLLQTAFFEPLLEIAGAPVRAANCRHLFGHCAAADAVRTAGEILAKDPHVHRVLVLGADSTCDAQSLAWLAAQHRLQSAENPAGCIPGEAGAAVMIERPATRDRGAANLATLHRVARAEVDHEAAAPEIGQRLAAVVLEALDGAVGVERCELWCDLNGEPWRADAWGHATVHLQKAPATRNSRQVLLASGLGELGAATGLVALVFATRAFVRGYARADRVVVGSVDDQRNVAAFVVSGA